jgi:hypothetical protein
MPATHSATTTVRKTVTMTVQNHPQIDALFADREN